MATDSHFSEVLDDLCVRFLNNLPSSEYESFQRLFFAVEAAHWFYEDFHRDSNPKLPKLPLSAFAKRLFAHSPMLRAYAPDVDELTADFKKYKKEVPTYGAAMLNPEMSKVLLVCGWGKGGKWGFPKGKIAKDETELEAAVREVFEETGFDFSTVLPKDGDLPVYIDSYESGRLSRIFVVPGVAETTKFETRTRKEISDIAWIPISALPDPRQKGGGDPGSIGTVGSQSTDKGQLSPKNYWLVRQYVPRLKTFIKRYRRGIASEANARVPTAAVAVSSDSNDFEKNSGKQRGVGGERQSTHDRSERQVASQNEETFGSSSLGGSALGSGSMSARERDEFFRQYLEEADRRRATLGGGDDFWPVPLVTSADLTSSCRTKPHSRGQKPRKGLMSTSSGKRLSPSSEDCNGSRTAGSRMTLGTEGFAFNREEVLACLY